MLRTELRGQRPGVVGLVLHLALLETDGERVNRLPGICGHDGQKRAGIDPGAEEQTHGHVASHLEADSVFDQPLVGFNQLGLVRLGPDLRRPVPIASDLAAFRTNGHQMGRGEFFDAME